MSVTAGVSDTVIAVRDKLRGKIGQTKVKRYWPGQAPEWAKDNDKVGDFRAAALEKAFPSRESAVADIMRKDDPRLRRLAQNRAGNRDEVREDHRRIRQAEIISTAEEESRRLEGMGMEDEEEDALEERRRRIKEKLLFQSQQEEAALMPVEEEEEEEEESESESEYETDSEEDNTGMAMVKPVFVPKSERDTIAERERVEAEERALEEAVRKMMEARKKETKEIVVEKIKEDMQIQKNLELESDFADVDTDDDVNEAEEYEAWKAREIARIKRDRDNREGMVREKEELEKVRNMTRDERREWERMNPKHRSGQSKEKWRFMQKYFHKGAFFQSDADDYGGTAGADGIYNRDFSAPTGEDKIDKSILPKVMQVKHFGRSGRTKWTHLVNEDTTDWHTDWNTEYALQNPDWWTFKSNIRHKYYSKMAAMNAPVARPKGSKNLKDWESPR